MKTYVRKSWIDALIYSIASELHIPRSRILMYRRNWIRNHEVLTKRVRKQAVKAWREISWPKLRSDYFPQ